MGFYQIFARKRSSP